jgi:P4 family phage/plasmid primase-like protien
VLAEAFVSQSQIAWFAESVYVYNHSSGVYEKKSRQWLEHVVLRFLINVLGTQNVEAALVSNVCRAIKNWVYLDEQHHPPFWIESKRRAEVFVTGNGIVSIEAVAAGASDVLLPHTHDLFAVCGVPYPYQPDAGCPRWLEFLHWMVGGNEGEVRLIQQFCAWVFIAFRLKFEKLLWFSGPGGNGKSTLLQIIRWVLGEGATSAVGLDAFQGGSTFRLWPTVHRLANFCLDAVVKKKSDVAALNSFVSGDCFTINRKFREQLTIEPSTACFVASNPLPLLDDPSDAFWRRLLLIRCDQRLTDEQINPTLISELKEEAPGILNWMLAALPGLMERRRFEIPESVRRNVENLKAEVNSVRQFLAEKVEAGEKSAFMSRDQFMELYGQWCKLNLLPEETFDVVKQEVRRAFGAEPTRVRRGDIRKTGIGRDRVRGWVGIRWQEGEEPPKSTSESMLENLYHMLADRDAEIRKLRERLGVYEPVKSKSGSRHTNASVGGEARGPAAQTSVAQDDDINAEDIEDVMKQLESDETVEVAKSREEN